MNLLKMCIAVVLSASGVLARDAPLLLPLPKRIEWGEGRVRIGGVLYARSKSPAIRTGISQLKERIDALGGEAQGEADDTALLWVGAMDDIRNLPVKQTMPADAKRPDGYVLRCMKVKGREVIICLGYDERGCYYALQTLIQLLRKDGDKVSTPRVNMADWPSFRVRLIKNSASHGNPAMIEKLAHVLPQYKINTYALQYHQEPNGTWRSPSEKYKENIETVGAIAKELGVLDPALYLCPFFKPRIDMSKREEVKLYIERLKWGLRQGFKWVEVDFNDWGKWENIKEAERAKFKDLGDYMAYLTNAVYKGVREEFPYTGVIVCPTTRWYRGRAKPELVTLCKEIPQDALVYWTGPVTRSRHITERQIKDWTEATGRKPFLWDNTIYAHFQPYWVGYSLNPFWNSFPDSLPELLEGGIHLNCSAAELYLPGLLTFADYVWNPEAYDPERSIQTALRLCWGDEAGAVAQQVREHLKAVHTMLEEARAGVKPFDKALAEETVSRIAQSVKRFGEVSNNAALAAAMDKAIVVNARKAVQQFKQPKTSRGKYVRKPLANGVINGGAENIANGRPLNWSLYSGGGKGKVTASSDARSGKYSACLEVTDWYYNHDDPKHGDRKWLNIALVHGGQGRGYEGWDAYDVEPNKAYRCTFWLRGDLPLVTVMAQGWRIGFTASDRRALDVYPFEIKPTSQWQHYAVSFQTSFDAKKLAIKFGILGYEDAGARLGKIWVDDLMIDVE